MTGKFFEDLEVGQAIQHSRTRTVTEADNILFCGLTMNTQPLHLDAEFAKQTPFGKPVINGIYTFGLVVGMTVQDLTEGTIVANLGYAQVIHPAPVFAGDTLSVTTRVLEKRVSESKKDRGVIKLKHVGKNQRDETVVEIERSVLFLRRPAK
jgi:acyl dehydratase